MHKLTLEPESKNTTADPAAVRPHVKRVPRRACKTGDTPSIILVIRSIIQATEVLFLA